MRPSKPMLVTPPADDADEPWCTLPRSRRGADRDRPAARGAIAARRRVPLDRIAVVFKTPAAVSLSGGGDLSAPPAFRIRSSDALPLAAEPTRRGARSGARRGRRAFSRATLVALLRSPHFVFCGDAQRATRESSRALLDRALSDGALSRRAASASAISSALEAVDAATARGAPRGRRWTRRSPAPRSELAPLTETHPASEQCACLAGVLDGARAAARGRRSVRARANAARAPAIARHAAVAGRACMPRTTIRAWTIDDLAMAVRRWIEEQTFVPEPTRPTAFICSTIRPPATATSTT